MQVCKCWDTHRYWIENWGYWWENTWFWSWGLFSPVRCCKGHSLFAVMVDENLVSRELRMVFSILILSRYYCARHLLCQTNNLSLQRKKCCVTVLLHLYHAGRTKVRTSSSTKGHTSQSQAKLVMSQQSNYKSPHGSERGFRTQIALRKQGRKRNPRHISYSCLVFTIPRRRTAREGNILIKIDRGSDSCRPSPV